MYVVWNMGSLFCRGDAMKIFYYQRWLPQLFLFLFLIVNVAIVSLMPAMIIASEAQWSLKSVRTVLTNQLLPWLSRQHALAPLAGNPTLHLSISLKMRNAQALDTLLAAQNNPHSSWYHHYLTPQEFTSQFGAEQATVNMASAYMQRQGLHVSSIAANRLLMDVDGPLSNVERAFGIHIAQYQLARDLVYAPTAAPSLPSALAGMILHIGGLDSVAHYHTYHSIQPEKASTRGGYTPLQLRTAYGIQPLFNDGETGSKHGVAFIELDGFNPADIAKFYAEYHLGTPNYKTILLGGAVNIPMTNAVEVELDMEVTAAVAPQAQQLLYMGQNDTQGINDIYTRIVNDDLAKVVSTSWGVCEAALDPAEQQVLNTIFRQGAAQGQAFFAATGDLGAYDCQNYSLAVDSPADNPYVIGVGGTSLMTYPGGVYKHESGWSCPTCTSSGGPYGEGGGGGVSKAFLRPSYQKGPGIYSLYRTVPDVSANADPRTGYSIYCTVLQSGCSTAGWLTVGGTSGAAPVWTALAIELNQYLAKQHKPVLGNAIALLYEIYSVRGLKYPAFHDITDGNNLYYAALVNYDLATGIGSPNGWNLARDLASFLTKSKK
jgi:subtilase family serine protease